MFIGAVIIAIAVFWGLGVVATAIQAAAAEIASKR